MFRSIAWTACVVLLAEVSWGHGGGLDALGCHRDRKAEEYHCHQGEFAGKTFSSKDEGLSRVIAGGEAGTRASETSPKSAQDAAYERELYGGWIDEDGDCQDTRQEVLIQESRRPVELDAKGCRVLRGEWLDPYTGRVFTNPSELDIDHFVPLAEVHRSRGASWSSERRRAYANDLANAETLIAVSKSANRSKGDKDPAQWLPPNQAYRCVYVRTWVRIKELWGLAADLAEERKVSEILSRCP